MGRVKTEVRDDGVAVLTLDDPGRRNALSRALSESIVEALASFEGSPAVGALVVTGTPPAFSAGAVLDELEGADREGLRRIYGGFLAVARFPFPTIAAVNGPAVGAGLNLALACDVRVAARSARFESRFVDLALHPGGGHAFLMHRLLGPQGAAAVVACGESLDGEQAVRRGLAWTCVDDGAVVKEAVRIAARAAATPRELARLLKATLTASATVRDHHRAVELELETQLWSLEQDAFRQRIAALKRRIASKNKE